MDNLFVYTPVRNKKTFITVVAIFALSLIVVIALSILLEWKWFDGAFTIVLLLNSLNLIFPIYQLLDKYTIDENEMTLTLKNLKKVLDIRQISSIEVYKTKRGKIKRILIRVPPVSFFQIVPYNKGEFIQHLKQLNANIEVVDKKSCRCPLLE